MDVQESETVPEINNAEDSVLKETCTKEVVEPVEPEVNEIELPGKEGNRNEEERPVQNEEIMIDGENGEKEAEEASAVVKFSQETDVDTESSTVSNETLDVSLTKDSIDGTNNNSAETSISESSQPKNYKNVILEDWDIEVPQSSVENRVVGNEEKKNGDAGIDKAEDVDGNTEKEVEQEYTNMVNDVENANEDKNFAESEPLDKKPNDIENELIKPVLDKKKNPLKYSNLIVSNQDIVEILDNSVERVCRPIMPAKDIFLSIELTKHLNQKLGPASASKILLNTPDPKNSSNNNESAKKILPEYQSKFVKTITNIESKEKETEENCNASDKSLTPEKAENASDQNKKGKKKTSKKNINLGDEMERTIALKQLRDEFPTTRRRSHTTKKINHIPFLASSVLEKALTSNVSVPAKSVSPRRRPCYLPENSTPEKDEVERLTKNVGEGSGQGEKADKGQKEVKLSDLSNTSAPVVRTYCIKRKSTETENEVKSALQTFLSASKEFQEGDEENIESKPKKQKTGQPEAQKSGKVVPKKGKLDGSKKRNLELEKLLGDEGAVRMLYETQHKDDNSRSSGKKSRKTTSGLKKDLMLKTKLVKNAVLRLSGANTDGVSLRGKRRSVKSEPESVPDQDELFATSTPNVILYKPKKKQRAEASRILYRHSSSESFDSDDEGEFRRSFEGEIVNNTKPTNSTLVNGELFKEKSVSEMDVSEMDDGSGSSRKWKTPKKTKMVGGKRLKKVKTRVGKLEKEASRESIDSQGNSKLIWSNVPVRKSCRLRVVSKKYSIWASTSMDSLSVESLGFKKAKKASQELTKKLNYKELRIRQHGNLFQIVLSPSSTVLKNSFNEQVLTELKEALNFLSEQENCSAILLTSTGTTFCQGIDLNYVLSVEEEDRKHTFGNLLNCLEKLILCLANYKKPIIAGVHAGAIGLGVTLLAFCDIIISSDRASFYTPYARLGQVSEGAATVTFPRISKNLVSELLYKSEKISAVEAMKFGLVSQVIPEERFDEELMLTSRRIASHSMQAMQSIKSLANKNDYEKIVEALVAESQMVLEHWCSNECINNIIKFLNSGEVQFRPLDVT